MKTISFDKILFRTVFCCMASDGNIDKREIELIKFMTDNSSYFKDIDFEVEINNLVKEINENSIQFFKEFFKILGNTNFEKLEEQTLIDFSIKTIMADEQIEYSEIKFFKNIRHRIKLSDEEILEIQPDIERFLEKDIETESILDKITNQYLENSNIPQFELIDFREFK